MSEGAGTKPGPPAARARRAGREEQAQPQAGRGLGGISAFEEEREGPRRPRRARPVRNSVAHRGQKLTFPTHRSPARTPVNRPPKGKTHAGTPTDLYRPSTNAGSTAFAKRLRKDEVIIAVRISEAGVCVHCEQQALCHAAMWRSAKLLANGDERWVRQLTASGQPERAQLVKVEIAVTVRIKAVKDGVAFALRLCRVSAPCDFSDDLLLSRHLRLHELSSLRLADRCSESVHRSVLRLHVVIGAGGFMLVRHPSFKGCRRRHH